MRIKKKLQINVVVSVLTALVICLMLFMAQLRVNRAMDTAEIANNLARSIFERSTFRDDYLRTNSERAKVQWFAKNEQINGLLKSAAEKFTDGEEKKIVDEMIKDQASIGKLFSVIVENRKNAGSDAGSAALSQEIESRLLTQLSVKLYDKILNASRLEKSGKELVLNALKLAVGGIIGVLAIVVALAVVSSWTMNRAITERIRRLGDGAAVIGRGDLDHHIVIKGDDEFADLSEAFNAMTLRLRGSYNDLEKEIEERKQAEERLREIAAELQAANTDLDHSRRAAINLMENALDARRQAEDAVAGLHESVRRYSALFANKINGMAHCRIITDEHGRPVDYVIQQVNDAYERIIGVKRADIEGRRATEVFPDIRKYALDYIGMYGKVALECGEIRFEDYFEATGQCLSIYAYSPLLGEFIAILSDVTDRKRAEEALRDNEERQRMVLEASEIGTFEVDIQTGEGRWNNIEYELLGLKPDDAPANPETFFQYVHPNDIGMIRMIWEKALRDGEFDAEFRIVRTDNQERWLAGKGRFLYESGVDDRPLRFLGVNYDITERKQAEEQLKTSLVEKEVMLREIHHRVKNNLQIISSLVSLQADSLADERMRELFNDVRARVRAMALVHEKLYQSADMARIDFAEYARSLLNYLWRAHGNSAASVRLTFDLEPLSLPVDTAVPCGLILNELASNALKHAFPGSGEGEVVVSLQGTSDGRVSLCLRDNGVGLPEEPDWRQTSSLGLRLVQMLAAQLNATVEVSVCGGTEFTLSFRLNTEG